ncbi:MAG: xanthine dehydrogenase family protein molybdopterin-binding subunit [Gemmatimonadetes bacterium]|nr:xanthine dehydrogenase family protein molybdopterin-binding subunit [Gemmatimonadota bacterium]MYG86699.1 xanthine dehydrogenase family protein molybdopterin-binding subunit [Gemmatimonadota bacterium]MYJ88533.1 xanthine dehydrogenase family protein molybdopterin-binding subunit [Gemmatimonadota bacterium]
MSQNGHKVIGTRPIRHDGVDKVTGRAIYGADIQLTGLLHGAIKRSPHPHARIKNIDTSRAEAHPGVRAVVTAHDLPQIADKLADLGEAIVNLRDASNNVLAYGKVLYKGHAVAGVAAINLHVAQEAVELIDVEYEALPHVTGVLEAMEDGAPILHEDMKTTSMGEETDKVSNVANHFQHKMGEPDDGFAEADVVIEREFTTQTVHQGYIETHNATAHWNEEGQLTIWTSTQGAFSVRDQMAEILQMPVSKVKIVPLEIGGGFGGKISVYLDPVAALLSKTTGHPVKMTMTRDEVFEGTGPTPGSYLKVKMGATNDGRLTAATAYMAYEAGAYPGSPVGAGAGCIFTPYDIPNVQIDGYDVCVNKPKTNAYRAPGATNAAYAAETVVDEISEKLGVDPLEFRVKNGAKEGTRRADGPVHPRVGCIETTEAALNSEHYRSSLAKSVNGKVRGRGVASGYWFNFNGGRSAISVSINPDGTINMLEGSTDIGGTRASIAMQLAETIGLEATDIKPYVVDTDSIGYTDVTGGSRTTFGTGYAAHATGQALIREMKERASKLWDVPADAIDFEDGVFSYRDDAEKRGSFKELASQAGDAGGPVVAQVSTNPDGSGGGAFATHVVDVEIDRETGKVDILRYTAVQDAGTAIHPSYVEGQMQGGVVQGIGWGLNEEYIYNDDGSMTNASFLDYRMPTTLDLPMIETIIVEVPNESHPYGVRGVGEVPIVPPPAALANAIYDATGVRLRDLPMSPPRVQKALAENGG